MFKWLRLLVPSALNRLINSLLCVPSLARGTCETSQVMLASGQVVRFRDILLSPHLLIGLAIIELMSLNLGKKKKKRNWIKRNASHFS